VTLATVKAALWCRPRSRVEWGFAIGLAAMALAGMAWLFTHSGGDDREALRQWFAVLRGDTSLKLRTPQYIHGGLMLAACTWTATAIALWLTRGWWCFSPASSKIKQSPVERPFWVALTLILLLAAAIRAPRLGLSLYNDEIDVFRTAIGGSFEPKVLDDPLNPGPAPFRMLSWSETVWGNRIGNNHALQSILARVCFDTWRSVTGAEAGVIREWPLRLPPLFGGLISIVAMALVARRWPINRAEGNRLGLITAFLLALHPWHVRYSTEARGYGLAFGFAALAFLFLILAAEHRQWRYWLAFGASQALCLWSCLGSLHLILGLNLVAAAAFLWPRRGADGTRSNPVRSATTQGWIVANVLSGAVFVLMAAPILPPIEMALKLNATFQQGVVNHWWPDVLGFLLLGMPWLDGDPANVMNPAILKYAVDPFVWIALAIIVTATASGLARFWRSGTLAGRLLVIAPLIGLVFPWVDSSLTHKILLKWYVNYMTLFVALWMAAGLHGGLLWLAKRTTPARLRLATYGILGLCALGWARPLVIYRQQSKQSLRGAIELARGGVFPFTEAQREPLVTGWWTHANYYDPYFKISATPEKLAAMVQRARQEERPLYFILGMRAAAIREDARIIERLENSGEFEVAKVLPGLEEEQFRTYVYRLRAIP
jgi:hypothetical protein